jgi:hypothetical protein
MGAHFFNNGHTVGIVHLADIYRFEGFTFEFHRYCGPIKCRKDGEPSKHPGGRRFFKTVERWQRLTKRQRERTRIYG